MRQTPAKRSHNRQACADKKRPRCHQQQTGNIERDVDVLPFAFLLAGQPFGRRLFERSPAQRRRRRKWPIKGWRVHRSPNIRSDQRRQVRERLLPGCGRQQARHRHPCRRICCLRRREGRQAGGIAAAAAVVMGASAATCRGNPEAMLASFHPCTWPAMKPFRYASPAAAFNWRMECRETIRRTAAMMRRIVMRADHISVPFGESPQTTFDAVLSSDWTNSSKKQPRCV